MHNSNSQSGFTLVEMIVSLALFSVVITMSIGALLMLVASNSQLQKEQSVMTNLSFAIDSMTREIRTGTMYFCASVDSRTSVVNEAIPPNHQIFRDGRDLDEGLKGLTKNCPDGFEDVDHKIQGIAFVESGNSVTGSAAERILYFYDGRPAADGGGKIYRRVGAGPAQPIVSSGIYITNAEFFVTGSTPLEAGGANSEDQPTVTIFIEATENADDTDPKTYEIQTMVTQRTLDL